MENVEFSKYVKLEDNLPSIPINDISKLVTLIETTVSMITNEDLEKIINEINFSYCDRTKVVILQIDIVKDKRAIIFGKKFSNISCIRRFTSNLSGLNGIFYKVETKE